MANTRSIVFDVTDAAGLGERTHIAGTLFAPTPESQARNKIALLLPGGGFTRRYYHLEVEGYTDYSAATQLAARGWTVLAVDNLGTGESTIPDDGRTVTLDRCASAVAAVVTQLGERSRQGDLHPSIPAGHPIIVCVGHSLGGAIATLLQGDHAACNAVAVLGFSCQYIKGAVDPETGKRLRERESTGNGYNKTDPTHHRERFYSKSVPLAIIEAEEAARVPMPDGVAEVIELGRTRPAAEQIEVPVLLAYGDRDVSPDPNAEPAFYSNSPGVTLILLPDSGHAHNSASGRVAFWNRIGDWMDSVVNAERDEV